MPWLSRRSSSESVSCDSTSEQDQQPIITDSVVTLIPAQIDGLCGTSPMYQKQNPKQILRNDLRVLFQTMACLPRMAMGLYLRQSWRMTRENVTIGGEALLQCYLALSQACMLCGSLGCFLFFPGSILAIWLGACWVVVAALRWPLNGPGIVRSLPKDVGSMDFSDERWIYINGMMTSNRSLKTQCDRLSQTFSRSVTGVHNSTYGLCFDLLTTLLLRSGIMTRTSCTKRLAAKIRYACLSNSVRKVILLSHSTGSLHLSLALDMLHAELPVDVLSKLEIYTFGSAASHLSNPLLHIENLSNVFNPAQATFTRSDGSIKSPVKATLASLGHRVEDHERVMPHIEHYALQSDMVARAGILHQVCNVLDNRFCGRVFVLNDSKLGPAAAAPGGGFLFEQYLDLLFPMVDGGSVASKFMHVPVVVDTVTAEKREFTAMGIAQPLKSVAQAPQHHHQQQEFSNQPASPPLTPPGVAESPNSTGFFNPPLLRNAKRASWGTAAALGIDGVGKARAAALDCQGCCLRQLSRLWRFENGGKPVGEGVSVMNGAAAGSGGY